MNEGHSTASSLLVLLLTLKTEKLADQLIIIMRLIRSSTIAKRTLIRANAVKLVGILARPLKQSCLFLNYLYLLIVAKLIRTFTPKKFFRLIILPNAPRSTSGSNLLWGWSLTRYLEKESVNSLVLPSYLSLLQRKAIIKFLDPCAILMIKGRHSFNYPSLYKPIPTLFILDDADFCHPYFVDQTLECCKTADIVISGNRNVAEWVSSHNATTSVIWVPHPLRPIIHNIDKRVRKPIVAWAHASPWDYPVEASFVQKVLIRLAQNTSFEFWIYGASDNATTARYLKPIHEAGIKTKILPFTKSYPKYLRSLQSVSVGLHPVCLENEYSQGKSFGKILSYIYSGVAVVTNPVLDHSIFFKNAINGMLASDVNEYAQSIRLLLADDILRDKITRQAYSDFVNELSAPVAARKISKILANL